MFHWKVDFKSFNLSTNLTHFGVRTASKKHFEVGRKMLSGGRPDYRSNDRYTGLKAEKPLDGEGYTGGSDRYTGGTQISDKNALEKYRTTSISDWTTGEAQRCFILMCWHVFGHWISLGMD